MPTRRPGLCRLTLDGQKLLLLNAKILAEHGDYVGAQSLLEEDLHFWRKVLESSDILITRMIATAPTRDGSRISKVCGALRSWL